MKNEVWISIKGYEGLYEISNLGRVKSIKRMRVRGYIRKKYNTKKYLTTSLCGKQFTIHRLVAKTFLPNPDNKPEINHINGIKTDNRVDNLEWVTNSENHFHAYRLGLTKGPYGEKQGRHKLTERQVRVIKHLKNIKPKMLQREVGKIFNTTKSNIGHIWRGINWKQVTLK